MAEVTINVSRAFNLQPHIDDIKTGIEADSSHASEKCTFMLKRKHFELSKSEILWVDKKPDGYKSKALTISSLPPEAAPCMWLYCDGWKPCAFTGKGLGSWETPTDKRCNFNLGMKWLNCGGSEKTDEEKREQSAQTSDCGKMPPHSVVTMVSWESDKNCALESNCPRETRREAAQARRSWRETNAAGERAGQKVARIETEYREVRKRQNAP